MNQLEINIGRRCEVLLGENAKPHSLFHYSLDDLDTWLPANLVRVQESYIGVHVLFKPPYVNGDAKVGVPPVNGRLEWQEPERVEQCVDIVHAIGGKIVNYVHPRVLRGAGMDSRAIVQEILRHCYEYGFDGVYLDGVELGDNIYETVAAYAELRGHGLIVFAHDSVQPHITGRTEMVYGHGQSGAGKVEWLMPTARLWTHRLWGETNPIPPDAADFPAWLRRMSQIATIPDCISYYKLGPALPPGVAETIPEARLGALFAWRKSPATFGSLHSRIPKYEATRAEYHLDREAFVRNIAKRWAQPVPTERK